MYAIELTIRPTAGLTFRRMPSSIVHISTYPFVPPPTLSGWLRRLLLLQAGIYPETAVKDPNFYVLPSTFYVLGAYPVPRPRRDADIIHKTRRHGPMFQSKHTHFSKLHRGRGSNNEKLQLHTWEYLMVDKLVGYVLHEDAEMLARLQAVQNFGCKLGKEGFAFLEHVSEVVKVTHQQRRAEPNTLVPGSALMGVPSHLYALYRHHFAADETDHPLGEAIPSQVTGFVPFWAGYPEGAVELSYWVSEENGWHFPVALVEELYGTH